MKDLSGPARWNSPDLSGAYAPILTPFTPDRELIDIDSFHSHLTFLEQSGLDGVLLLGTNGEFDQLTVEERLLLVDTALSVSSRLKIIVGGTIPDSVPGTFDLVSKLSEYAPQISAVLVSPPFYSKSARGPSMPIPRIVEFYRDLTRVQDRLPLMLYNVPLPAKGMITTAPITTEVVASLRDESIIVGIKDSSARLENIEAYLDAKPGIQVLVGSDFIIGPGLNRGATGSITACGNIFPPAVLAVYKARTKQGQLDAQSELNRLRALLNTFPAKRVSIQKNLLAYLGIVSYGSPVRDQNRDLTGLEKEKIINKLLELTDGLSINQAVRQTILTQRPAFHN
ncbi:dihydrodipicolinate synthase family protein [Candidatus Neomarinimicrobiota bacterium]